MNLHSDTLEYLYRLKNRGVKLNLDRVYEFQRLLGYPDRAYRTIHVAGTNGKGSVVHYISAMLQSLPELTVGMYTSPHLLRFNERVQVNGNLVPDEYIAGFFREWRPEIDRLELTYFEATTMLALEYFRDRVVDVAVLETGLGGRLDATNIVDPLVTVITSIGFDHTAELGDTLAEIAGEKAGIMKPGVPCVLGPMPEEARIVCEHHATETGSPLVPVWSDYSLASMQIEPSGTRFIIQTDTKRREIRMQMLGEQVVNNAAIALRTLDAQTEYPIPWEQRIGALGAVSIPGRLELLHRHPYVYYDVAHNYDGIEQLLRNLNRMFPQQEIRFLLCIGAQKDISGLPRLFEKRGELGVMESGEMASHSLEDWAGIFPQDQVRYFGKGEQAVARFCGEVAPGQLGVITGSHYIAGEVYSGVDFLLDS